MTDYKFCILKDNNEIIEYEKGLYKAYTKLTQSDWRKDNYKIIDGCRYKCNIPYSEQLIYAIKQNNKIMMALSVKVINTNDKMIIEKLGFSIDLEDKMKKICEGLDFYSFIRLGLACFVLYTKFFNFFINDLKEKGFKVFYGTCEEKLKLFYKEIGFKFIDNIYLNGKKEYLLKIDFE